MNKGTILYIGGFELPDKNAAAHRVLANANSLRDCGYKVVFAGVNKQPEPSSGSYDVEGFKCYDIKYPETFSEWFRHLTSIKKIKTIIKEEKITHIIGYNYPAVVFYRLLNYSKTTNIKFLADCTEWYEPAGNFIFRTIKGLDVNFRMKYLHTRVAGLIVISNYLEDFYRYRNVKNIINVPPLVDLSHRKWKIDPKVPVIEKRYNLIYSGSPGSGNKDRLDIIVKSLKRFYINEKIDLRFNVVGITKDDYIKIFNKDKELDSSYDFIKFHGKVAHQESIRLLKQADFSIFFRVNNLTNIAGFPTKFVESISAGTPVITNISSNLEKYFTAKNEFIGFLIKDLEQENINDVFGKIFTIDKQTISAYKLKCKNSRLFSYDKYNDEFNQLMRLASHY